MGVIGWRFYDWGPSPMMEALEQLMSDRRLRTPWTPMPINVFQEGADVVVEASLPGVRPQDVDLSCSDNLLTIRARARVAEREYVHQEMHSVEYLRQVPLPGDCRFDLASAGLEGGLLTVRVPKARNRIPEKIRIQVNRRSSDPGRTIDAEPGSDYTTSA
jgi:HSP20 family protein